MAWWKHALAGGPTWFCAAWLAAWGSAAAADSQAIPEWWEVDGPARAAPAVLGTYNRGCVSGARALPLDGPGYHVMRPSRDRFYGHPSLVAFLNGFAAAVRTGGYQGLLIGDLAQPRGGPMRSGHASHQVGLDADIWFMAPPAHPLTRDERETMSARTMLDATGLMVDSAVFGQRQIYLLETAARVPQVARIFVHPAIKQALCERVQGGRLWLNKIRPWWGHHYHFHVRLRCPAGDAACEDQAPPPPGDGCDASLAWWFTEEALLKPKPKDTKPVVRRKLTLADLPSQCRAVLLEK